MNDDSKSFLSLDKEEDIRLSTLQIPPPFSSTLRKRPNFENEEISTPKTVKQAPNVNNATINNHLTNMQREETPNFYNKKPLDYETNSTKRYPYENAVQMFNDVSNFMRVEWEQNNIAQTRNKDLEHQLRRTQESLQSCANDKCQLESQNMYLKERINDINKW